MRAEVIAIGDEIITGQRLDTNSQWLSERLTDLGIQVAFHTTIGDRLEDNTVAFGTAIERADVVVSTGGLGPTADDLTREALALATGEELVFDEASFRHIRHLFDSRGREMPERNRVQAMFPKGSKPITNEHGTAPGIQMRIDRPCCLPCLVFALPGVPAELKPMWEHTVAPAIRAAQPSPRVYVHHRMKCFGVGESMLESMLPDLINRQREPIVGITASDATLTLRITASGPTEVAARQAIFPTEQIIRRELGTLVYGTEEEELEDAVAKLLFQRKQTVSVAEWATAGLVSRWLGALPGAERVFAGGVAVGSAEQARRLLGAELGDAAPDSPEAAVQLAEAIRERSGADFGLGVAAYPVKRDGPDSHVCAAIAAPDRTHKGRFPCATSPSIIDARSAKHALNGFRLFLLKEQ